MCVLGWLRHDKYVQRPNGKILDPRWTMPRYMYQRETYGVHAEGCGYFIAKQAGECIKKGFFCLINGFNVLFTRS